jgi:hypothetical protein
VRTAGSQALSQPSLRPMPGEISPYVGKKSVLCPQNLERSSDERSGESQASLSLLEGSVEQFGIHQGAPITCLDRSSPGVLFDMADVGRLVSDAVCQVMTYCELAREQTLRNLSRFAHVHSIVFRAEICA